MMGNDPTSCDNTIMIVALIDCNICPINFFDFSAFFDSKMHFIALVFEDFKDQLVRKADQSHSPLMVKRGSNKGY